MKIILIRITSLFFFLHVIFPPAFAAEQLGLPAPDIEPPKILFNNSTTELTAGINTFKAKVTDNIGVANVTLYFKNANDVAFKPRTMTRSSTDPDIYTTELSLDPVISNKLQVYVRADDVSGNSIFEGQKFSPLTFTVVPGTAGNEASPIAEKAAAEEEGMSTLTMILIGLGVAALAGGGGGGGGGGAAAPSTGSITITTDVPN